MKNENTPTTRYLFDEVLKDFVTFEDNKILLSESIPKELALFLYFIMPVFVRIIFMPDNIYCECGSKTHKHVITEWKMDNKYQFYKYYHVCPKCGKSLKPEMDGIVENGCCYTWEIRDYIIEMCSKEHISYEKVAEMINDKYNLDITRQNVFYAHKKKSDNYLSAKEDKIKERLQEKNITPTGFPGHDEAFCSSDREKYAYFAMIDSNNQMIINDSLFPEEDYRDYLPGFIEYSQTDLTVYDDPTSPNPPHPLLLPDFKKDTLIGDGLREYPKIAQSLNMDFHPCVFHKIFKPNQEIWNHQSKINKKIESLKNKKERNQRIIDKKSRINKGKRGRIPDSDKKRRNAKDKSTTLKIENHEIDTKIRRLKKHYKEFDNHSKAISNIFDSDTIKEAKRKFNTLYNKRKFLPDEVTKFLNNLKKDLDATLSYIENENIPKTNNWLELFFNIVFPKKYRKRFRTLWGVKTFLRYGKIRWYERIVLKEKIQIDKPDNWTKIKNKYATTKDF